MARIYPSENKIRVGYRCLTSAAPITGGTGQRAGTLRAHAQGIARVQARNASAAGAHLEDVHHCNLNRQGTLVSADERAAGCQRHAVEDHTGFCSGPSHIEGDRIADACPFSNCLYADDTGSGPGFKHTHALAARLIGVEQTARRLHDEKRALEVPARDMVFDLFDVAVHARTDIGVRSHGRHLRARIRDIRARGSCEAVMKTPGSSSRRIASTRFS